MKVSVCQCVCVLAIVALAIKIDSVIQKHIEKAFYHGAAFVSCLIDGRRDQFLYGADVYRGQRDCCNAMQS